MYRMLGQLKEKQLFSKDGTVYFVKQHVGSTIDVVALGNVNTINPDLPYIPYTNGQTYEITFAQTEVVIPIGE